MVRHDYDDEEWYKSKSNLWWHLKLLHYVYLVVLKKIYISNDTYFLPPGYIFFWIFQELTI